LETATPRATGAAPARKGEAFLLEPRADGGAWTDLLVEYLRTFRAEDPVTLFLVPDAAAPGAAEAARRVLALVAEAGAGPDVQACAGAEELVSRLKDYDRARWVRPGSPPDTAFDTTARLDPAALAPIVRRMAATGEGTDACLELGCLPMPVHFYSPVPDIPDLARRQVWKRKSALAGIDFRPDAQVALLRELGRDHGAECDWPAGPTADPHQFHLNNGSFSFGCAASLHTLLRRFRPRRVIEVGSGQSSRVIAAAARRNAAEGSPVDYTVIDPYPGEPMGTLPGLTRLVPARVETTAPEAFEALEAGDLLFIDSSHQVKIGGDVNFLYLDVLPRLRPGVLVHVHDIGLPYEYPEVYFTNPRFRVFWTEAYLLQAFLACNAEFEVLLAMHWIQAERPAEFREAFPLHDPARCPAGSGSFWMRRKPA